MVKEGYGEGYRMAITRDAEIAALKPEERLAVKRYAIQSKHGGGLKIEIRLSGLKRFVYRYKIAGKEGELLIGGYPAITLAKAREFHAEAAALVKKGINPQQYQAQEKARNEAALTMAQLMSRWLESYKLTADVKPLTIKSHGDRWRIHLEKHLGNIRLLDLARPHLTQALEAMRRNAKEETRKALSTLNLALDYALSHHWIEDNPARLLRPQDFKATMSKGRERWLTMQELKECWQAIDRQSRESAPKETGGQLLSVPVANVLRLLILTGCRRGEVTAMRFSHINGNKWVIPDTKNGKPHTVYLCPLALAIIEEQRTLSTGDVVFESATTTGVALRNDSVTHSLSRLRKASLPKLPAFTVHDLRRSAATNWAEQLGAEERVIEICLNHQPQNKLVRTYHKSRHHEKTKSVWISWGELVAAKIANTPVQTANNVITINFGSQH